MRRHDDTPPERHCPGVLPRGSHYPAAGDQDHRSPERMSSMRAPDLGSGSRLRHASQGQGAANSPGRGRSTAGRACGRVSSACRQGALTCAATSGCLGQANLGHQVHVDVQHLRCLRASHVMRVAAQKALQGWLSAHERPEMSSSGPLSATSCPQLTPRIEHGLVDRVAAGQARPPGPPAARHSARSRRRPAAGGASDPPALRDAPRRPDPATLPPGRVPARSRSGSRSQSLAAIAIPWQEMSVC
jgi:hypothetical protein